MNSRKSARLNLKQTASAAHIYGRREAQAEAFTQMEQDRTHWSLGPYDLKPYANDAFCEGINRFMLHQSTCQPPEDGNQVRSFALDSILHPILLGGNNHPHSSLIYHDANIYCKKVNS